MYEWKCELAALSCELKGRTARSGVVRLVALSLRARRLSEVRRLNEVAENVAEWKLGYMDDAAPYLDAAILETMRCIVSRIGVASATEKVRRLVTLYRKYGVKFLDAALACGTATFVGSEAREILSRWAGLANQRGKAVALPRELTRDSVLEWAKEVLDAAYEEEGSNHPSAYAELSGNRFTFWWSGTCTRGRYLSASMSFDKDMMPEEIVVEWNSATGGPSRFLEIESLLELPGFTAFEEVQPASSPQGDD